MTPPVLRTIPSYVAGSHHAIRFHPKVTGRMKEAFLTPSSVPLHRWTVGGIDNSVQGFAWRGLGKITQDSSGPSSHRYML
jgi:hypothetical protein